MKACRHRWLLPLVVALLLMAMVVGCATPTPTPVPPQPTAVPTAAPEPTNAPAATGDADELILATTTSTENSGLLAEILPAFEQKAGVTVSVIAVGTGQALALGKDGNADVLLVHARAQEDAFMADGHGTRREDVMYNDFVIVGPASDPAGIKGMKTVAQAMAAIADTKAIFVSRGDDSGTHVKEKAIWADAGLEPAEDWYVSAGQGMGAVLTMADEQQGYTLSDRATYLALTLEGTELEIVVEGDPIMFNPYGVMTVNPNKGAHIKADLANQFVDWLISEEAQQLIGEFGVAEFGAPLFVPDSQLWRDAQDSEASAPADGSVEVVDAKGRTMAFKALPSRIVVPGKGSWMVGHPLYLFPEAQGRMLSLEARRGTVSDFLDCFVPGFSALPRLEMEASAEQIAPLKPDAVLIKSYMGATLGDSLEKLNLPVVYLDLETPDQFYNDMQTLGQLFGNIKRADEIVAYYQGKVEMIASRVAALSSNKPSVLVIQYNDMAEEQGFTVPPMDWMQSQEVILAGGQPVWAEAAGPGGWSVVNLEQIAAWNPDVIMVIAFGTDPTELMAKLKADANWQALSAVQNAKLYAYPADHYGWDVPDPRWILGTTWAATKLHPDTFADVDMLAETRAFYSQMYGMDDATIDNCVVPYLKGDIN